MKLCQLVIREHRHDDTVSLSFLMKWEKEGWKWKYSYVRYNTRKPWKSGQWLTYAGAENYNSELKFSSSNIDITLFHAFSRYFQPPFPEKNIHNHASEYPVNIYYLIQWNVDKNNCRDEENVKNTKYFLFPILLPIHRIPFFIMKFKLIEISI
jgi:hypothetical protein